MFNIISNSEKEFLLKNLSHDKRIDNRQLEDYRNIKITKLDENGQIETKLGNTLVISQIFAKLVSPNKDRPSEGVIVFSIDSNSLRPSAEYHQANEELNELRNKLSNLLDKSLRETKALDSFSLCVAPEQLVWKIVVDINVINNDGNLYDTCMLSCLASWMTYKIPFIRKSGNKLKIEKQLINLSILHTPLSITFALYGDKYILDPNLKEERLADGIVIISANKFNEICYLHTYGSVRVDNQTISELLIVAKDKIKYLNQTLKDFINKSEKRSIRDGEDIMVVDEENINEITPTVNTSNSSDKKKGINLFSIKSK